MERKESTPPPIHRKTDKPINVLPHLLRDKEHDLEWLKWASKQSYQQKSTLRDINNRINEIENV